MITLKNPQEIKTMRAGGKIVAKVLKRLRKELRHSGVRASYLNDLAEEIILENKAEPSFKNYEGFPAALCVSINSEVVHGIPDCNKVIGKGDLVGLDVGVKYKGLYTDAAITVGVGKLSAKSNDLILTCKQALFKGIAQACPGEHVGDISSAIQKHVESKGYSVVRELVGHGVGYKVHEEPRIPNYGMKGEGPLLKVGMTLCLEPMINLGESPVILQSDGQTFKTVDESLSAHFEHTIAITKQKPLILTA